MAKRFTRDLQERMAQSLRRELVASGIIPDTVRVAIVEGSRTYGRCWYVALIPEDTGAHHDIPQIGDLRRVTGGELWDACMVVVNTLTAARRVREQDDYMKRRYADLCPVEEWEATAEKCPCAFCTCGNPEARAGVTA